LSESEKYNFKSFHYLFLDNEQTDFIDIHEICDNLFKIFEDNNINIYEYIRMMQVPEERVINYFNNELSKGDIKNTADCYKNYLNKLFYLNAYVRTREQKVLIAHIIFTFMIYCGYPMMKKFENLRNAIYSKINQPDFKDYMNSEKYLKYFDNHHQYNLMKYDL